MEKRGEEGEQEVGGRGVATPVPLPPTDHLTVARKNRKLARKPGAGWLAINKS